LDQILFPLEYGLQAVLESLGILVGLLKRFLYFDQSEWEIEYLVRLQGLREEAHPQGII
jgi:hypothetical protein